MAVKWSSIAIYLLSSCCNASQSTFPAMLVSSPVSK